MNSISYYPKFNQLPVWYALTGLLWLGSIPTTGAQTKPCSPDCITLSIKRLPDHTPVPQGLPTPTFSPQNGEVAFGAVVTLIAASLPDGAILHYSSDNGHNWTSSNQIAITGQVSLLGRVRLNQQVSTYAQASFTPYFQRMMVVGNSIMSHAPAPELGWFNFNGMAASAPEKDFVHLLTARLTSKCPQTTYQLQSGGDFEHEFGQPTYSIDQFDNPVRIFKPDLIVVRIGENVDDGEVPGPRNFESQFRQLLERLASLNPSQPVKIICTTSIWHKPNTDAAIRKVTADRGYPLVDLSSMVGSLTILPISTPIRS